MSMEGYYRFILNRLDGELKLNYKQLVKYEKNEGFGFRSDYSALEKYRKQLELIIEGWRKK